MREVRVTPPPTAFSLSSSPLRSHLGAYTGMPTQREMLRLACKKNQAIKKINQGNKFTEFLGEKKEDLLPLVFNTHCGEGALCGKNKRSHGS